LEGRRFEVVPTGQQAVTYACLNLGTDGNGDGTGTLTRYWLYGFRATQAAPAALGGARSAILADRVSACNFVYNTSNARNSLVAATLTITRGGESVNLYHEIHVNNIP
jgi:MSHA biogenesis protein MshO